MTTDSSDHTEASNRLQATRTPGAAGSGRPDGQTPDPHPNDGIGRHIDLLRPTFRRLSSDLFGQHVLCVGPDVHGLEHLHVRRTIRATLDGRADLSLQREEPALDDQAAHCDAPRHLGTIDCAARMLPFSADSLDGVVLVHAFGHCDQPRALIREACRVLRPGGLLIIQDLHPLGIVRLRRLWQRRVAPLLALDAPLADDVDGYAHALWPGRAEEWLDLLGFRVEYLGDAAAGDRGWRIERDARDAGDTRSGPRTLRWPSPRLPGLWLLRARKIDPALIRPDRVQRPRPVLVPIGVAAARRDRVDS